MKKLYFILSFILLAFSALAEEPDFGDQDTVLGQAHLITPPSCNDPLFIEKLQHLMHTYFDIKANESALSRRKKTLKLQQLHEFETVDAQNFAPTDDFIVAGVLMALKINEKIEAKDIVLCRQKNVKTNPVYVVSYPYMDNFKSCLINFDETNSTNQDICFIYP